MIQARPYQVERLDWAGRKAFVARTNADYYTDAIDYTRLKILDRFEAAPRATGLAAHGEVHLVRRFPGYKKIRYYTHDNVGYGNINLPDQEMHSTAVWWQADPRALESALPQKQLAIEGFLGAAYALHHVAALHAMAELRDLGRAVGDGQGTWSAVVGPDGRGQLQGRRRAVRRTWTEASSRPCFSTTTTRAGSGSPHPFTTPPRAWWRRPWTWWPAAPARRAVPPASGPCSPGTRTDPSAPRPRRRRSCACWRGAAMGFEERLRRVRGEGAAPPAMPESAGPSLEERLARLQAVRRPAQGSAQPQAAADPQALAQALGGEVLAHGLVRVEHRIPLSQSHGQIALGDGLAALPGLLPEGAGDGVRDPAGWRLLDTETSGLAGGTGTWVFACGIGRIDGAVLVLEQFVLARLDAEAPFLAAITAALSGASLLVTYNGKSFDLPLLATRLGLTARDGGYVGHAGAMADKGLGDAPASPVSPRASQGSPISICSTPSAAPSPRSGQTADWLPPRPGSLSWCVRATCPGPRPRRPGSTGYGAGAPSL